MKFRRFHDLAAILLLTLSSGLLAGCGQMIADSMFSDKYLKTIKQSALIEALSQKSAVNAAVSAAGKTQWTPKTISVDTGYMLAEWTPTVGARNAARNYAFTLEARLPSSGKGEATVTITPPQGLISTEITMEGLASKYLESLQAEAKAAKP